nr:MAG TPA: hypothetical protein [Caudoviricetes sp.]
MVLRERNSLVVEPSSCEAWLRVKQSLTFLLYQSHYALPHIFNMFSS